MTSADSNAFFGADSAARPAGGSPVRNLASSLAPLRASLEEAPYGWRLDLSPMRAFDAFRLWSTLWEDDRSGALVFDVDLVSPVLRRALATPDKTPRRTLRSLAEQFGLEIAEAFDENVLAVDDQTMRELAGLVSARKWRSVLVGGPIEPRDAAAIVDAVRNGRSALDVELRAEATLTVEHDRTITLEARRKLPALTLVAENFRHYLAALRGRPAAEFTAPEPWQIERLLSLTGSLTVRPIETDVFSTFLDVGVSTDASGASRPADRSLIYDLPSNSWHDES